MTESGSATIRVELDLAVDAEPIQGQACDADGVQHVFAGWLDLVAVLDRARASRSDSSGRSRTTAEEQA